MGASVPIEVSQTEGDIDIERRKERLLQLRLDGLSRKEKEREKDAAKIEWMLTHCAITGQDCAMSELMCL